jgi:phage FluMu protein Com
MPTVRCPSCNRALNLPESSDIVTAKCPLCQTAFPVVDRVESPPRPRPTTAPVARAVLREQTPGPLPFDLEPGRPDSLGRDNRKALGAASSWCKAAGFVGLLHTILCWCGTFGNVSNDTFVAGYCIGHLLQIAVSVLVYRGASALTARRSFGTAQLAGLMAFVAVVFEVLFAIPLVVTLGDALDRSSSSRGRTGPGEEVPICLFLLALQLVVVALFLMAGVKTLLALNRPGVRQGFPR